MSDIDDIEAAIKSAAYNQWRSECCRDPPGNSGLHFDQDPYGEFRGWVCFTCLEELEVDDAADVGDAQ